MNSSYKITLLVTIVLCGLVLGYYISLDDQNQPPTLDDKSTNTAAIDTSTPSSNQTRPTLRYPSASVPANPNTNSHNSFTSPSAATTPPAGSSSTGSLLDRVNARVQGSSDPIAPPPAATIPAASSSTNTRSVNATTPVTSDARSMLTGSNTPSSAGASPNSNAVSPSRNPSGIPDTGRAALQSNTPTTGRTYTIKSGDTLSSIAEQTLGSTARWNDIAEANPYLDPRKLKVGQVIRLPDPASSNAGTPAAASSNASISTAAGPLEYVVREGDTLSRIARVHYSDPNLWDVIYRANKAAIGSDPAGIKAGMKLFIPPEPRSAH